MPERVIRPLPVLVTVPPAVLLKIPLLMTVLPEPLTVRALFLMSKVLPVKASVAPELEESVVASASKKLLPL